MVMSSDWEVVVCMQSLCADNSTACHFPTSGVASARVLTPCSVKQHPERSGLRLKNHARWAYTSAARDDSSSRDMRSTANLLLCARIRSNAPLVSDASWAKKNNAY